MIDIYPKLKYVKILGDKIVSNKELSIVKKNLSELSEKAPFIKSALYSMECYGIVIEKERAEIYCDSDRAFNYGLLTLKELQRQHVLYNSIIFDYPHMKIRGIIEGFYGNPWSFDERREAIDTVSKYKMNTYIYAPKNDLYHRTKWSEPYPKEELARLRELVNHCSNKYIDFYYTLAPGVSMRYTNSEHLKLLLNKYMQLYEIGVRNFGILFDDIPIELVDVKDKIFFQTSENAHSYIVNKLYEHFKIIDKDCSLIVCGSLYYGRGNEKYIVNLGKRIPSDVKIFWTGRSICSQEQDSRDTVYFFKNTLHKPFYWDNYPVNDTDMAYEMHLGPSKGRDSDLYKYSEGLVCNVMEYKEASMIPVITIADYLWNSLEYDEETSMKRAILELVGEKDINNFIKFSKFCLKSCLNPMGNEEFLKKIAQIQYMKNEGNIKTILEELLEYFQENLKSAKVLKKSMENKVLLEDILRWLNKFIAFNKLWIRCIRCAKEYNCGSKLRALYIFIPIPLQSWRYRKNPINMMNFDTKALIDNLRM